MDRPDKPESQVQFKVNSDRRILALQLLKARLACLEQQLRSMNGVT